MTLALITLGAWALITVVELVIGLSGMTSVALTGLSTLAVPVLTVAVAAMVREELEVDTEPSKGAVRKHRRLWVRTFVVHGVVVVLLGGCLFGKYQVLYHALQDPDAAASLASSCETYGVGAFLVVVAGVLGSPQRLAGILASVADRPARLMAGSFGLAAIIGTVVLALPVSLNRVHDASLVDALFNAVSAVCVTGLAVNDVATTYSFFGQLVLFILFQIGGLGIMSLSSFFAVLSGQRLRARRARAMAELLDVDSFATLRKSLLGLVVFTLVVELVGAAWLYLSLGEVDGRAWVALFHAVSAFCNAGFSNLDDGLFPYAESASVSLAVTTLIIIGRIGFPVIFELLGRVRDKVRRVRPPVLTLHTRVVLVTSLVLWGGGAAAFLLLESGGAMSALGWPHRLLAAVFQSVTCRTAGFSTVDFGAMAPATWMVACLLMFVGASPGSTGGGVKTTTLATLYATLGAELRRAPQPSLAGRALGDSTVRRAIAVTFINVIVLAVLIFVLLLTEHHDPSRLVFEAVSAVSTSGLSTGITGELSLAGKIVVTLGMFLGRIGPLTAALVVAEERRGKRFRLVEERIAIG